MKPWPRAWTWQLILSLSLLWGCSRNKATPHGGTSASASPEALSSFATYAPPASNAHDPAHPPIDCPLRKQGIDATHLRPFEDVAKYIAFLERPDRAEWQKPDDVVTALGLHGEETILDIGAGSGYFSFRFAKAVPKGRVIAADPEAEMVRHIHHRVVSAGIDNLQAKLIQPNDPGVDATVDLVFLCDVLHHVADRSTWMSRLSTNMKSGARLALIEFKEGKLREGPPEAMKIPRADLLALGTKAGLTLEKEHDSLLPYQVFLVFRKP